MYIGTNLCYDVGTLNYVQDEKANLQLIYIIAGSVVGGILVLSLFIISIVICGYIRSKKKYAHMLMELKEVKMEDKYRKESHDIEFTNTGMTRRVCLYVTCITISFCSCMCMCTP